MQTGSNTVILTADGKINAQCAHDQDSTKDQVKAFLLVNQPLRDQYAAAARDASNQNGESLCPVRTLMPSAGSGPLPTPHAVPHQSPPAQMAQPDAFFSTTQSSTQEEQITAGHDDVGNAVNALLMGGSIPNAPQGAPPKGQRPRPGRTAPK